MDIQVPMDKVLEITQAKLAEALKENIMLQAVVQGQQEEVTSLRETVDRLNEDNKDKEDGSGSEE